MALKEGSSILAALLTWAAREARIPAEEEHGHGQGTPSKALDLLTIYQFMDTLGRGGASRESLSAEEVAYGLG